MCVCVCNSICINNSIYSICSDIASSICVILKADQLESYPGSPTEASSMMMRCRW